MLTPDQIRLRLERIVDQGEACNGCLCLIAVLHDLLPQLVAPPTPRDRPESQWCHLCRASFQEGLEHFGSEQHRHEAYRLHRLECLSCYKTLRCQQAQEILAERQPECDRSIWTGSIQRNHARQCPDCTPEQPCERARRLLSGG